MRIRDPQKEKAIRLKTMELAVHEGFDGLSMQKVAKAAKVSAGTLYVYFKDREDMILRISLEELARMTDSTMEGFHPAMSFDEGLRVQWINRARYSMENPLASQFLEQMRFTPLHEKALKTAGNSFKEIMSVFLQNATRNGELAPMSVEVYWAVAFAPLYQLVKFHRQGKSLPGMGKFALTEKTLLQTLELVLKALKPGPEEQAKRIAADAQADAHDKKSGRRKSALPLKSQRKQDK